MKSFTSLENMSINISNSIIIGTSILTLGIISTPYLNHINSLQLFHMKYKNRMIIKQSDTSINLIDLINYENKLINKYWYRFNIAFILGITGISLVVRKCLLKLQ